MSAASVATNPLIPVLREAFATGTEVHLLVRDRWLTGRVTFISEDSHLLRLEHEETKVYLDTLYIHGLEVPCVSTATQPE